jgi:hypothetical protein
MGTATSERSDGSTPPWATRLLREPTLHFFVLAAVALVVGKLAAGDPRTISITPALKSDLLRRYHDQLSRAPTPEEAASFMATWKSEEALYREALREGLDRDDPTVRAVLISKMRERVLLQNRIAEPSEAELQKYLAEHRDQFEAPLLIQHEYVAFPKAQRDASEKRRAAERELVKGQTPASLGLASTAANVTRDRIEQDLGPGVAGQIMRLPPSQWHELETSDRLLLVKLVRIEGGLPPPAELHDRLVAAVKAEREQKAVTAATRAIAERYRFVETAK